MSQLIALIDEPQKKPRLPELKAGDTVRVHQKIREGNRERIQIFEGVVIRFRNPRGLNSNVTVRKIASGVGVEKTYLLHSPNVTKIEIVKRSKVRQAFLSYLRERRGKSARLKDRDFDSLLANVAEDEPVSDDEVSELEEDAVADPAKEAIPLQEVEKEENKEAAETAEEPKTLKEDDEAEMPAQEAEAGEERGEDEQTRDQNKS